MRVSRQLLILTLLAAVLCSDRDAALASPVPQRAVPTQGLMRRLSAQLRTAIATRKLLIQCIQTSNVVSAHPMRVQFVTSEHVNLQTWLLSLPPPAAC